MFKKIAEILGFNQKILISCYGKLPVYKDFIFISTDARETYYFKEWMDKGFGKSQDKGLSSAGYRILIAFPQQRNIVVASIWNSSDTGGLRQFPFAFFVVLPRGVLKDTGINTLVPIWEALEGYYAAVNEVKDISEFYKKYRGLSLDIKDMEPSTDISEQLQHISIDVLRESLFKENSRQCWHNLLQDISTILTLPQTVNGREVDIALRLPLAISIDIPLQIEMWIRLIRANFPGQLPIPTILFPQKGEAGDLLSCNILWRNPSHDDTQLLGNDIGEYQHVMDLTQITGEGSGNLMIEGIKTMADMSQYQFVIAQYPVAIPEN